MILIGYVDGQEIRFDFHPPSQFTATLPAKKSGTCIVELHAIDDAGNVSAYCDTVIMIDFDHLSVRVVKPEFMSRERSNPFNAKALCARFLSQKHGDRFTTKEIGAEYAYEELI